LRRQRVSRPLDQLRLRAVYGEAIENYFNDAPVDIGIRTHFSSARTPIECEALPSLGIVAFIDLNWKANILHYPVKDVFLGPELEWGKRDNFADGFSSDDWRIQFWVIGTSVFL
jgi:hypothetical protein